MATAIPARLTRVEGRNFGLTVGGAFLLLAALLWWRDKGAAPAVGALGALFVAAGLLVPTRLGPVQRGWMAMAHLISKVTTPLFMGIVYYAVLTPIALLMRMLGRNPLGRRRGADSYWVARDAVGPTGNMERQF